jgi:two-component system chemotaxis response regulator CheY
LTLLANFVQYIQDFEECGVFTPVSKTKGGLAMDTTIPVLIVDDQQPMRRTIADIMRGLGFSKLAYAEDGLMAWEKLNREDFGLVLLDWSMPRMTGIELLKKIRQSEEKFKDIPVLMITAEADRTNVVEAIQSGVTNYIVKPFTPATLDKKIRDILATVVKPFTPPPA